MKFGKKEVNLLLSILAFILATSFTIGIYLPKNSLYTKKSNEVDRLVNHYDLASSLISEIPKVQEKIDKARIQKQKVLEIMPTEIDNLEVLVTLERITEEMNVDLTSLSEENSSTQTVIPTEESGESSVNANQESTEAIEETEEIQSNPNRLAYKLTVKGEYNSILILMYKLQNLKYPNSIENFELSYNKSTGSEVGYPLEASFTLVFMKQTGGGF